MNGNIKYNGDIKDAIKDQKLNENQLQELVNLRGSKAFEILANVHKYQKGKFADRILKQVIDDDTKLAKLVSELRGREKAISNLIIIPQVAEEILKSKIKHT